MLTPPSKKVTQFSRLNHRNTRTWTCTSYVVSEAGVNLNVETRTSVGYAVDEGCRT